LWNIFVSEEPGLKAGQVFHPLRVAVSGRTENPTLLKMPEYMGKPKILGRLEKTLEFRA